MLTVRTGMIGKETPLKVISLCDAMTILIKEPFVRI